MGSDQHLTVGQRLLSDENNACWIPIRLYITIIIIIIIIIIYPLTARVVGAPQIISQPVSSIFPLFSTVLLDLPNSRPVHSLMLSSHLFLCLPCLSLCLARWFWPDLMNGKHDHTTAVCQEVFVWSNCLLDLGTDFLVGNTVFV